METWKYICLVILLFLLVLMLVFYLYMLRRQMDRLREELKETRVDDYNKPLTLTLMDSHLEQLAAEQNLNLEYQRQLKISTEQSELKLRQSISDIAHDLRTPLTVVKGNLQLMSEDDTLSAETNAYLATCVEKTEILKNMVDDFFELSVLESDSAPVETRPVNVTNLLMQFVLDHEAMLRTAALEPDIRLPETSVTIFADEQMLLRMLSNLLNNVVKYAKDSFVLSLEPQRDAGVCRITFANQIDADAQLEVSKLFDRTYRGNKARPGAGAGLGLYIVKLLAEKQGARVYGSKSDTMLELHMEFPISNDEERSL